MIPHTISHGFHDKCDKHIHRGIYGHFPLGGMHHCHHPDMNLHIQQHLGEKGYSVIRHIYNNLPWLHELSSSIGTLDYLQNNIHKLGDIASNMDILKKLTGSVDSVEYLADNIDVIIDFVPRMKEFKEGVTAINKAKSEIEEMALKITECHKLLSSKLEQAQELLDEAMLRRDVLLEALSEIDDNSQAIAQLKATTATTDYNIYGQENQRAKAQELIEKSENYSNDESDNKGKYEFTRHNGSVLDNMQELATEVNKEVQVVIYDER